MRRFARLSSRPWNKHPLSGMLSFIISAGLILIPVLPVTAASVRASSGTRANEDASPVIARQALLGAALIAPPLVPSITATKTDSFADPDNDGKAVPGQTITYTVTITNNGTDATNVVFSDTVDANTTLVPGSVSTQPIASNDSYNVLGNVRIQPNAAAGLLANDCDPDNGGPCSSAGLTASGPTTSANGGNVVVNANGSFSYNPPAGFEGADSFTYTVTDPTGKTDTATASFTVNDVVWFVDNTAAAGGDGRLTSPYNSLAPLNGADLDEPSDVIFVHEGAGAYGGGIVLEDNQRLVGQGTSLDSALSLFGITVPAHSDARPAATSNPTLANTAGNVITLANGNAVLYLNAAGAPSASAISGSGVGGTTVITNVGVTAAGGANGVSFTNLAGALTMSNSTITGNSSGTAVLISGGANGLTFNNTDVSQNGGSVVDIQSRTGGTVLFDAASSVTGTNGTTDAVSLLSNNGTITFNGPVQLNTNATGARGLVADSGTVNMTNAANTVSSTGGAAVDIENLTVSLNFATTFSTNSNGRGLRVVSVNGAASFGNTAVNNSSNTGVLVTDNAASVTFADLDIAPAAGVRALHAVNNAGTITSSSGVVSTTGATAVEITGASAAARSPLNVQLTSISASGAPVGIALLNTSGGFRVLGAGGNCTTADPTCTGGTIQTSTGNGVDLNTADNVALNSLRVTTSADTGINGSNVNGFVLNNALVDANGNTDATDDSGVKFAGLTGTASGGSNPTSITNSTLSNNFEAQLQVANSAGTLTDLQMSGNAISAIGGGVVPPGNLLNFLGTGTATMKLSLTSGSFTGNAPATGTGVNCDSSGSATLTCNASGASFVNNNVALTVSQATGGNLSFSAANNTATGNRSHALNLFVNANGSGTVNGEFVNNVVGTVGVLNSGSATGIGIRIQNESGAPGAAPVNVLVSGNTVQEIATGAAVNVIQGLTGQTTSRSTQLTITNNTLRRINGNRAIIIQQNNVSASPAGAAGTTCADISGNEMNNISGSVGDGSKLRLVQRVTGTFNVRQTSLADLAAKNSPPTPGVTTTTTTAQISVAGTLTFNGGACAQPTLISSLIHAETDARQQLAAIDTASPQQTEQVTHVGFAQNREAADWMSSLRKIRSGFSYSKEAMPLGLLGFGPSADDARDEASHATLAAAQPVAAMAGETINIPVGTLRAGDSVTITFQVTIEDPFDGALPQVSNQGTVTADGGVSVQTDDPSEPGAANPTVTPLLLPPTIDINDATVAEPATGSANMLFTVSLSHPFTQTVTVNFQTANGGANPATAGTDYTTTNGTVTFAAGETVQTASVPVLADGDASEGSETFLVNLSGATNGVIGDGQATGTITDESVASQLIISELRARGPNGANDDFVELLNTTDTDITVAASDASSGWSIVKSGADCSDTPVVVGVIPNGTVIPARGNYLLTGSAYSLGAYATGDASLTADIEDNRNVGLFTTAEVTNISSVNRLDAVGFGANTSNNCDLLREGNTFPSLTPFSVDYSLVRQVSKGLTQDTTDNAADFIVVDTNGTSLGGGQNLGAPGPEGLASPRGPVPCSATTGAALFGRDLIDTGVGVASAPNVARDLTSDPANNSTFGTIDFRRTFTNNTGANVTRLRFRIIDLSTFPAPSGTADLRARTSSSIVVSTTGGNKTVLGTTLEQPPAQPNGGGINASLAAGTVTLATPLASGASINLRFLFGVQQTGDYDIAFVLESSPGSGKDFWKLSGHTENGGHTDGGCNRAPVANAGADQSVECSGGQASVTLDGSGSTDPDGDTPLTYEWREGATVLGTTQTLNVTLPYGPHTITLKVTDPSGDSSEDTVEVNVVDTTDPVVTDPPDVTVMTGPDASSCGTTVSDAVLGTASATDGCEGALPVNRTGVPAGNFFPVGTTQVTYTATDAAGNVGMETQNVTVIDNTKPVVTPPANITTNADANSCSATVNPGTATATDNCNVQSIVGTRSDNQPLNAPYPVGTTTITWTATDVNGNTGTAQQTVTVQDNQPPTVSSSVTVTTMGPPFNHALINVGLAATAFDNCFGLGPLQVFVYSDEDDGPAPHSPDATNIGIGSLKLRRERDGGSDGRVYLVVVKATDGSGNTAASCSTVTVPASNSAASQSAVNAQAAAAASFCSANNGAAPSGYFVVGP